MLCKRKEDSGCCLKSHEKKMIPCALVAISVLATIAGFIIGHCMIGKCCHTFDNKQEKE